MTVAEPILNENNYLRLSLPPNRSYGRGFIPRTNEVGACEVAAAADFELIPRSEWPDRIREMERSKSRLSDIINDAGIPCLNQASTNFCHAFSPALAVMALRASTGQKYVPLSPGSIAGPVTGYRNRGANIQDDLRQIVRGGIATTAFVPERQISRDGWKPGAEENALLHRVTEWWDMPRSMMFDRLMTLLLLRIPVCTAHYWWSHAVTAIDPWMDSAGRKFGHRDRNSWGSGYGENGYFIQMEGKGTPDEAYAPRVTTGYQEEFTQSRLSEGAPSASLFAVV